MIGIGKNFGISNRHDLINEDRSRAGIDLTQEIQSGKEWTCHTFTVGGEDLEMDMIGRERRMETMISI